MPATIITYSGDKRIQLSNSQLIRRPIYYNSWTKMRIGIHFCIPAAASIGGTPRLYLGICSGLTNGIGDATTTNFVGFMTNNATMTRTSLAGPNIYSGSLAWRFIKKVGTTFNFNTADAATSFFLSMQQPVRHGLIVEITKGSPNYSMQAAYPTANGATATDLSDTQMLGLMEMTNMSDAGTVVTNYAGGSFTNTTIAADEVAGSFNAINVFWDRTVAPLEISAIYHRKVA
jgi:hypothetical protein